MNDRKSTKKQQRKEMLKKYEGKLEGPYDHLKEGVDYLDDIQRNKNGRAVKDWEKDEGLHNSIH